MDYVELKFHNCPRPLRFLSPDNGGTEGGERGEGLLSYSNLMFLMNSVNLASVTIFSVSLAPCVFAISA